MPQKSTTSHKHPGGRHLSTVEIICVCVILLVGFLFLNHRAKNRGNEEKAPAHPVASEEQQASSPALRTKPSFREPGSVGNRGACSVEPPSVAQPVRLLTPEMLALVVEEDDQLVSAVDTGTGTVSVVYADGTALAVPEAELLAAVDGDRIRLTTAMHLDKKQGLFRAPMDDLREQASQVASDEGADQDKPRSVQLDTFKRLAENGAGYREARKALENLVPEEMPIAIDVLDQRPWGPESRELMQRVMAKWGASDPMGALAHADTYDSLRKRNDAVNSVLNSYAKNDPEGALSWYFNNLESDPRTKNFNPSVVFKELASKDFNGALQRVNQIEDRSVRQNSLRYMLSTVEQEQRYEVIENMYYQSNDLDDQKMFASEYVMSKSRYEPYEAANWIASNVEHPEIQQKAIDMLIYNWSADRPDQAADWVMRLSDQEMRQKQLTSISRNWSRYDPEAAEAWLASFPPDPDLDGAVSGHISVLRKDNPGAASEWLGQISSPETRQRAERSLAKEWIETDPVSARNFILKSTLDEKYRTRYLNEANQAIAVLQQFAPAEADQ